MLKVTLIFDNEFASPLSPDEFVREYYLTAQGLKDLRYSKIKQGDSFKELNNPPERSGKEE